MCQHFRKPTAGLPSSADSLGAGFFLVAIGQAIGKIVDVMTNETIQTLRREAESLAPSTSLANRIRFTVYAWQDEKLPLDEQEHRLNKIVTLLRNGEAFNFTFTFKA